MKNSKIIILIILIAVAFTFIARNVSAPKKWKSKAASKIAKVAAAKSQRISSASAVRRARKTTFTAWEKDIFFAKAAPLQANIEFKGTVGQGANIKAILGESIAGKGDRVGIFTVISIADDAVVLSDGSKEITVKLSK